jgi:hypothetical protein
MLTAQWLGARTWLDGAAFYQLIALRCAPVSSHST